MENGNNSSKMSPSNSTNGGEKLKGSNQSGNAVKLDPDDSYDVDSSSDDDICELEHLRKLFVGGLTPYTTEETLKTFYEQWGKVVDVVVMRDIASRRSRGFGFVTYTKAYMVDKAQDARPHMIDGKTVEAKRALPRPEREKREPNISVKKLFVGGLKDNHDEECLKEYFSQFGNVISVKILTDKTTGKRRGFAFIEYDDYDAVDKAILKKTHSIKYVVVDVKKSVYNQEQQRKNSAAANNPPTPNMSGPNMGGPPPPGYGPPPGPGMPPYQYPPPMNTAPPNMNYWGQGPPQQPPQNYGGGYQPKNAFYQQPPPPQPGNWNYPSMPPNTWGTAAPPPPCPPPGPVNWQQGPPAQWSGGPPPGTVSGGVSGGGGAAPPPNWNNAPTSAPPSGPPVAPPAVPPQAPNFGAGYQQNYGGGPTKNSTANTNRMNPYCPPPHFGNQNAQSGNHNFNNYNGGAPTGPPGVGPTGPPPVNNASSGPKPVPPVNNANRRY